MTQTADNESDRTQLTARLYSADPSDQADAHLALQEIDESDPRHTATDSATEKRGHHD